MTPMVFHAIDFSASQVGSGLALSALVGTVVRLLSGALLDRGLSCSWPIRFTTILAVLADITLFRANSYGGFVVGEILLGSAAGLYWPAIELAVPLSCGAVPSGRGYALVRSSDALGFGIGALIGSLCAWLGTLRLIYGVEAICMIAVLVLISLYPLLDERSSTAEARQRQTPEPRLKPTWLLPLLPVLAISIMATGILSLEQSALPIDLVRGGLERPGLSETSSGGLIALQLSLLVILQWPVGRWLAERSVGFGLGLSLSSFSLACLLLGVSALTSSGTTLVVLALLPMALAQAAFLPTATEAVIETPPQHRGLPWRCFPSASPSAPWLPPCWAEHFWTNRVTASCSGWAWRWPVGHAPNGYQLRPRFDSSGSQEHLVDAVAGNPGPLGG